MNRKAKILSILVLGVLIPSICFSAMTKAIVASDQLELTKDSYVEGKLLYTNSSVTDELLYYPTLKVEDIYNLTDIALNVVQLKYSLSIPTGSEDPLGFDDLSTFELTHLILEHNRTTILPAARIYLANSSWSIEITNLGYTTYEDLTNINKTKVIYDNGTIFEYGDYYDNPEINEWMFVWAIINWGFGEYYKWTLFGISPTANVGDKINYVDLDCDCDALGEVIDKPAVTTSNGDAYDTIHVEYVYNSLFGFWDAPEVDAFYEARSGLLIRWIETDGIETFEFVPGEVLIKRAGLIPFPFIGVVVGLTAIGLSAVFVRKKKK